MFLESVAADLRKMGKTGGRLCALLRAVPLGFLSQPEAAVVEILTHAIQANCHSVVENVAFSSPHALFKLPTSVIHNAQDLGQVIKTCLAATSNEDWVRANFGWVSKSPRVVAALCGVQLSSELRQDLDKAALRLLQKLLSKKAPSDDLGILAEACANRSLELKVAAPSVAKKDTPNFGLLVAQEYTTLDKEVLFKQLFQACVKDRSCPARQVMTRWLKSRGPLVKPCLLGFLESGGDSEVLTVLQIYWDTPICFTNVYYKFLRLVLRRCHESTDLLPVLLSTISHVLATRNFNVIAVEVGACLGSCLQLYRVSCVESIARIVGAVLKHRAPHCPQNFPLIQQLLYRFLDTSFDQPSSCEVVCRTLCALARSKLHSRLKALYLGVVEQFFILAGTRSMSDELKQSLLPGLFAVFDVCSEKEIHRLAARMTDSEKLAFAEVRDTYKKRFRYKGQ